MIETPRMIGDVRRAGKYTAIIKDILNFPYGEIRSVIINVQHNCASDRKMYGRLEDPLIKHEYCVVFKRVGDGSTSTAGPMLECEGRVPSHRGVLSGARR